MQGHVSKVGKVYLHVKATAHGLSSRHAPHQLVQHDWQARVCKSGLSEGKCHTNCRSGAGQQRSWTEWLRPASRTTAVAVENLQPAAIPPPRISAPVGQPAARPPGPAAATLTPAEAPGCLMGMFVRPRGDGGRSPSYAKEVVGLRELPSGHTGTGRDICKVTCMCWPT